MNKFTVVFVLSCLLAACTNQPQKHIEASSKALSEADIDKLLSDAAALIKQGSTKKALAGPLAQADAACDHKYANSDKHIYTAREPKETLMLMLIAAADDKKKNAVVANSSCPDVFYLIGYANIDMGKLDEAINYVRKAIDKSPLNSHYLSELGHLYQTQGNHEESLKTFKKSEEAATKWSPDLVKNDELARAKRGVGYNLIELGRLDEAEAKFKECLTLNPNDAMAKNELSYIENLRKPKPTQ